MTDRLNHNASLSKGLPRSKGIKTRRNRYNKRHYMSKGLPRSKGIKTPPQHQTAAKPQVQRPSPLKGD